MTDAAGLRHVGGSAAGAEQAERLGVEEEFHVVDLTTRELVARGPDLLERLSDQFTAELQKSVVESNSSVCNTLDELRIDLERLRAELVSVADDLGLGVVAAGTVPLVDPEVLALTDSARFRQMHADYQLLVREQLICGTQVHVDVPDRDVAVAVAQRVLPWLPVLLALSASSPFWLGQDSGYASSRSLAWQRWPTAGGSGATTAAEHDALVSDLVSSPRRSRDPGMIYFDVRPSPNLATLELRITDSCPDVDSIVLLAGLFRALVRCESATPCSRARHPRNSPTRCSEQRSGGRARSGLEGNLLTLPRSARPVPAPAAVASLLDAPARHLGDRRRLGPGVQTRGAHRRQRQLGRGAAPGASVVGGRWPTSSTSSSRKPAAIMSSP